MTDTYVIGKGSVQVMQEEKTIVVKMKSVQLVYTEEWYDELMIEFDLNETAGHRELVDFFYKNFKELCECKTLDEFNMVLYNPCSRCDNPGDCASCELI